MISMKFGTDICDLRMNPIDLDDALISSLVPPAGQRFQLSRETSRHLLDGWA